MQPPTGGAALTFVRCQRRTNCARDRQKLPTGRSGGLKEIPSSGASRAGSAREFIASLVPVVTPGSPDSQAGGPEIRRGILAQGGSPIPS